VHARALWVLRTPSGILFDVLIHNTGKPSCNYAKVKKIPRAIPFLTLTRNGLLQRIIYNVAYLQAYFVFGAPHRSGPKNFNIRFLGFHGNGY
jgi:hypothetical protein